MNARVEYFKSAVDGAIHPCIVCPTELSTTPKPLIVEVSPGGTNLSFGMELAERIASAAAKHGKACIVLRPTGRGPGTVYQNYGEVDLLEALDHVLSNYPVDRRRISVTGHSMGGAATWYLASHYPDLFSAAAPVSGYCDYRLWEKPGGLTFPMQEWEEFSWRSRSAAFLPENLINTPVWIVHGERDRAVGGGVPVEHSRRMTRSLDELGFRYRYTEKPETGHGCPTDDEVILWLMDQEKETHPRRVLHAAYTLRHNRSHWLTVDRLRRYGERGCCDAVWKDGGGMTVTTENVDALSLEFGGEEGPLVVDGQQLPRTGPSRKLRLSRDSGGCWSPADEASPAGGAFKRHGVSGPVGDLFYDGLTLVPGTSGDEERTFYNDWVARHAAGFFRSRNGGVHRGGIPGETSVRLECRTDTDLSGELRRSRNLLLYGGPASNSLLRRFELPVSFGENTLKLHDREFIAEGVALFAVFPHPENPGRYVAVHGGGRPDAICWGSHLDMMLLPDYLVYAEARVLEWGFWDNEWGFQS